MKKVLSVCLSVLFLLTALPLGAVSVAAATSGTTGDCTWTLDGTHLTISGNGDMEYYEWGCGPWGSSITSVTIEYGVTSIGNEAFYNCRNLTSVTIPNSVTSIAGGAFFRCSSLTEVIIPDSVRDIGYQAFSSCSSLTSVSIGDGVTSIEEQAFAYCSSLTSVTIPAGVTYIGEWAFRYCSSLSSIEVDENNTHYSSAGGALLNKDQTALICCPAGMSGAYAIPDGVTTIEWQAFFNCTALTSVTIPDSVTTIGESAFHECTSLTTVTLGGSVTIISASAFENCTSLTDVYYGSVEADREKISMGRWNDSLLNATWHYSSDPTPGGPLPVLNIDFEDGEIAFTGTAGTLAVTEENGNKYLSWNAAVWDWSNIYHFTALTADTNYTVKFKAKADRNTRLHFILNNNWLVDTVNKLVDVTTDWQEYELHINSGNASDPILMFKSYYTSANSTACYLDDIVITKGGTPDPDEPIVPAEPVDPALNAVINGDFEIGDATGWTTYKNSVVSSVAAHSGSYGLLLQGSGGSGPMGTYMATQTLTVTPGKYYKLSMWVKAGTHSRLDMQLCVGDGVRCQTRWDRNEWTYREFKFKGSSDMVLKFLSVDYDTASVYVDDIILTELNEVYFDGCTHTYDNDCDADCNMCGEMREVGDHTYTASVTTAPTCGAAGMKTYACTICGDSYTESIPATGAHDLLHAAAVAPTCTEDGNVEYWYCADCGQVWLDEACTQITNLKNVVVPTTGHVYDNTTDLDCNLCGAVREVADASSLLYEIVDGAVTITGYTDALPADLVIPATIGGYPVTAIGDEAFNACTSLTSVTVPDSVTTIGDSAFNACTSLTSVTIPDSVTTIGGSAFSSCTSLTAVIIPDSVTTIGGSAFYACGSLTGITVDAENPYYSSLEGVLFNKNQTVLIQCPGGKTGAYTIPDSVISIGGWAFAWCTSLTAVTIPDSVTTVVRSAFFHCESLTSVTIPDSVATIEKSVFQKCISLTSVIIPNSVTTIGNYAFADCASLTSVNIPDGVTTIGEQAFTYCTSLASVTLPQSITTIGRYAFYNYSGTSLTDVYYGGSESDRAAISIGSGNDHLLNATWHYTCSHIYDNATDPDCNLCGAVREVADVIPGDANGDGKIGMLDLALLQRYLNGWDVSIITLAVDVNADGKVNNLDMALLQRYLNGWDVELKLPV